MNNAGVPQKTRRINTKNLMHFSFLKVFFRPESESKTPATSEIELFVTLANG